MFFGVNFAAGIYAATAAFMVVTLIALVVAKWRYHKLPVMPLVSGVVVLVFGTLTLYLRDETFIKLKPTIVYLTFAALLGAGLLLKKPVLELLLGPVFNLTEQGWRKLTLTMGAVLRRHGGGERAGVAQLLHRHLGDVQGLRLSADHLRLCAGADAADAALRHCARRQRPKRGEPPGRASLTLVPLQAKSLKFY